jgi:hypothetical protein
VDEAKPGSDGPYRQEDDVSHPVFRTQGGVMPLHAW